MADESLAELDLKEEGLANGTGEKEVSLSKSVTVFMMVLVIVAGGFSGFFLAKIKGKETNLGTPKIQGEIPETVAKGQTFGSSDTETFKDQAIGRLEKNENGTQEGTHRLTREGGPDQTAYLISSVVDLDKVVGRQVEIWGETFYSDKVGWLMDVGRLKVLD